MTTIYDFERKFPKVFVTGVDKEGNEVIGIRKNATLRDLFNAYSDLVHYIDGEIIIILEELIKEKIDNL